MLIISIWRSPTARRFSYSKLSEEFARGRVVALFGISIAIEKY